MDDSHRGERKEAHTSGYAGEGASYIIKALEPTAYSFGFAYASGGGSPPAFGGGPWL
jgi:hypothetical protein